MNSSYSLNFVIPQGPTGPTGPIGAANGLNAYGEVYRSTNQTLTSADTTPVAVDFDQAGESVDVNTATPNTITIEEAGNYLISYTAVINNQAAEATTVTVNNAGNTIDSLTTVITPQANQDTTYTNMGIVPLAVGDTLTLNVAGATTLNGTLNNASLTVTKLN